MMVSAMYVCRSVVSVATYKITLNVMVLHILALHFLELIKESFGSINCYEVHSVWCSLFGVLVDL